jgi:DNA polymerase-3 subunit delta
VAAKKEFKNDLQTLKEDLRAKQPGRLYIFHGEETFLLHHYLEQLKKQLLD